jgi:hypothetical protein
MWHRFDLDSYQSRHMRPAFTLARGICSESMPGPLARLDYQPDKGRDVGSQPMWFSGRSTVGRDAPSSAIRWNETCTDMKTLQRHLRRAFQNCGRTMRRSTANYTNRSQLILRNKPLNLKIKKH